MRDDLHRAELIVVLEPETFPFRELRDVTRDVPLVISSAQDRSTEFREWIGPFDRIVAPDDAGLETFSGDAGESNPASLVQRLLSAAGDIPAARRAKTVHRIESEAVESVLETFLATVESGTRTFEVLAEDAPSLVSGREGDHERCTVEAPASESLPESGFDAGICAGLLRHADADFRVRALAGAWRAVKPGGRVVLVETFVFDRESRERMAAPPVSVSGCVEDVMRATSGRVTLDFMRSLKYPPDEVHRAAIFSFFRL